MKRPHERARYAVWLWLAVLTGILLIAYALWSPTPKLPVYQGKTLYEWIAELDRAAELHPAEFGKVAAAQAAIRAIGTNAVPIALANLRAQETLTDRATGWLAQRAPFLKLRPKDVRARWELGAQIIDILGPIAAPCLPELTEGTLHGSGHGEEALLAVGAAALPAFTNLLSTSPPGEKSLLLSALIQSVRDGRIKPEEATAVLPRLVAIFHSKDRLAGSEAARAMGVIHQQPEVCVPLLEEGFSEPSLDLLADCIEALGGFGGTASKYVDKIAAAYDNTNKFVREAVCKTLGRVHDKDSVVVPVLIRGLQDTAPQVQESSALVLGRLAALPDLAIPALEKSLQNPSSRCRWASAQALGQFGPRATNSIPILEKSCSDRDQMVRESASNALRAIRLEPGTYFVEPDTN